MDIGQIAGPGQDTAPHGVALRHASVKQIVTWSIDTPWPEVLAAWRADAKARRRLIRKMHRAALALEQAGGAA